MIDQLSLYIVPIIAVLAGVVGVFFKGKSSGRQQERDKRDAQLKRQDNEATAQSRKVENEIANSSDDDIRKRANDWLRKQ